MLIVCCRAVTLAKAFVYSGNWAMMAVLLMLMCYIDLFDVSNYNHLLTPRMTSQTDLWANPEEFVFEAEEYYVNKGGDANNE